MTKNCPPEQVFIFIQRRDPSRTRMSRIFPRTIEDNGKHTHFGTTFDVFTSTRRRIIRITGQRILNPEFRCPRTYVSRHPTVCAHVVRSGKEPGTVKKKRDNLVGKNVYVFFSRSMGIIRRNVTSKSNGRAIV